MLNLGPGWVGVSCAVGTDPAWMTSKREAPSLVGSSMEMLIAGGAVGLNTRSPPCSFLSTESIDSSLRSTLGSSSPEDVCPPSDDVVVDVASSVDDGEDSRS